jgi:hypothetical protein
MIWPFLILLGNKRRPKLLSMAWLLFHAQNVLEFFSDSRIFFEIFRKTDLNFSNFSKEYFSKNGQRLVPVSVLAQAGPSYCKRTQAILSNSWKSQQKC